MRIGIIGRNGFIGSALAKRLSADNTIYSYPRPDLDVLYHFGSPSSDIIYKQNLDWALSETINSFLRVVQYCRDHMIKLVYPSSANVYQKTTVYSHGKAALEEIHAAYGGDILGLRIFCGYGLGEAHKGDYASIVYQFVQGMKKGYRPIVYGDGAQTRDFVWIDDIVDGILSAVNDGQTGVIDIGTGQNTSFNRVVELINHELGKNLQPVYVEKPLLYVNDTPCNNPLPTFTSIEEGVKMLCKK